jgi:hypothetical protein
MISFSKGIWLVGLGSIALGCVQRISNDDSRGSASDGEATPLGGGPGNSESGTSQGDSSASDEGAAGGDDVDDGDITTTGPAIMCENGWTACDGECTLLGADAANCGECGHGCKGAGTTRRCSNWECEPGIWPCIKPDQGIDTCTEACASVGQICDDAAYCAGYVRVWTTTSANDQDPEGSIEACERLVGSNTSFMQSCDDPIDWAYESFGKTVLGVACCCTQD